MDCYMLFADVYIRKWGNMKVNRNWLLAIASLVWFIAGFNILRIGVQAHKHSVYLSNVILSV